MKAKKKSKGSSVSTEAEIIAASVSYCSNIAAATAAFSGDPTGSSTFAEPAADIYSDNARKQLRKIVEMRATSAKALSAKARACVALVNDIGGDMPEPLWSEAFRTFARDVKEYFRETIEAEYAAEVVATRNGGAA